MPIELIDDGTMDTVVRCSECSAEQRYNYDPESEGAFNDPKEDYDSFVEWAIEDFASEHECNR